jgi:hypothetical protein
MQQQLTRTRAAAAGLAGTAAVAGAMAAARRAGLTELEFPRILATLLADEGDAPHTTAWALFVANGAVLALGYRTALRIFGGPATACRGGALGLAHGLVAGGGAALLAPLHPRPRAARLGTRRRPRPTAQDLAIVACVHVLYGAVLGTLARGRGVGGLAPVLAR